MYTDQQVEALTKEVRAISDLIAATEKLISEETDNPSEPADNIIHTDFTVLREYEENFYERIPLDKMVGMFHDWAAKTYELAEKNRGKFQNKKVLNHVATNLGVVSQIGKVLPEDPHGSPPEEPDRS